jgi:hypothetical protein
MCDVKRVMYEIGNVQNLLCMKFVMGARRLVRAPFVFCGQNFGKIMNQIGARMLLYTEASKK